MKKTLPILLVLVLGFFEFSCRNNEETGEGAQTSRIEAEIVNLPDGPMQAKISRMGTKGPERLDSSDIEASGKFTLEAPSDTERLYILEIGPQRLPVFMEPGTHSLKADFKDLYNSATYSNSPLTLLMRKVESIRIGFEAKAQALEYAYKSSMMRQNPGGADSAMQGFFDLQLQTKNFMKGLIDSIGPNPVSHLATSMLSVDEDFGYLDSLALRFEKERPQAAYTKKMNAFLEVPRKFAVGKPAPDFSQSNPAGKPVNLSQFRGKWVLLDFWASWCKPCRAENPNLVAAFQKFKGKGFTILSISLDGEREPWMKAMVQDRMFWAHGSDLKGWANSAARLYSVNSIPASFLIDPDGKIAGKNLRGPALEQKLSQVLH